jgi:hypothetical protein
MTDWNFNLTPLGNPWRSYRCGPDTHEAGSSSHNAAEIEQPGRRNELAAALRKQFPKALQEEGQVQKEDDH